MNRHFEKDLLVKLTTATIKEDVTYQDLTAEIFYLIEHM